MRARDHTRRSRKRPSRRRKAAQQTAESLYAEASRLAAAGEIAQARKFYERLKADTADPRLRALVHNDLAAIAATDGDPDGAMNELRMALTIDPNCEPARLNLALLEVDVLVEGQGTRVEGQKETTSVQQSAISDQQSTHSPDPQRFPKCLLLMITYNRLEYTRLALDAVLQLDYPKLEIVVWDNGSTDATPEFLKERLRGAPNVRLELSPTNLGVVNPMNAVWFGKHDAELLAKVDNDTLIPPDLIRRLADCHVRSNHFGALSGFHFRKEGEAIADPKNIVTVNGAKVFRQRFVGGCAIMARRDVLERIGPILSRRAEEDRPFMDGGWTSYQQRLDELGYINGYPWPFVHVDHMEDTRSPHCIRTDEHQQYKQALRGMSLEEFTQELCVWKPH
jgi:hypothetical protein